jgi:hypothetical protein
MFHILGDEFSFESMPKSKLITNSFFKKNEVFEMDDR